MEASPEYLLAHQALRFNALSDPMMFLAVVASPDAERFLRAVIDSVFKHCGKPATFGPEDIKIHPVRAGGHPCAVLELPEPKRMAEAFLVALVVPIDESATESPDPDSVRGRYFTLEKGEEITGESRTVLCEWTKDNHLNFGDGPAAEVEAFVAAIERHL